MLKVVVKTIALLAILFVMLYVGMNNGHLIDFQFPVAGTTDKTPIRRAGDGRLPARGWDGSMDWTGFVPFDAMPHIENPASGQIANANSRPAPADHPVFLGVDWYGDWRLRRIRELLAERPTHDLAGFAAMQNDVVSLLALGEAIRG